jgi:hypothetical protein
MNPANRWDTYFKGHVEFDWISPSVKPEDLSEAIGGVLIVKAGPRIKNGQDTGDVLVQNLKVTGGKIERT